VVKPEKLAFASSPTAQSTPSTAPKPVIAVVSTVPSFLDLLKAFDTNVEDVEVCFAACLAVRFVDL